VLVQVLPAPVANAGSDATVCFGQDYQLQGSGGVRYQWSPATYLSSTTIAAPTSVMPGASMQYSLYVWDANNCRSLREDVMRLTVTPPIKVTATKDTVVSLNDQVQLFASAAAVTYTWSPAAGLNNADIPNPVAVITQDVRYKVTVTNTLGCTGEAFVTIKVYDGPEIYVPNAFTPNNDGRNDIFRPFPVGIKKLNYFRVYNRWGQVIYATSTLNAGWDGKVNGVEQPPGTYVWVAEAVTKNDKVIAKKGTVVLIR
jgi:gliding motility-associated-like protein